MIKSTKEPDIPDPRQIWRKVHVSFLRTSGLPNRPKSRFFLIHRVYFPCNHDNDLSIDYTTTRLHDYTTTVQENSRFWPNLGFRLHYTQPSPNFMEITNIWFILSAAQWLKRYRLLPVYFRKICIKLTSELCSGKFLRN